MKRFNNSENIFLISSAKIVMSVELKEKLHFEIYKKTDRPLWTFVIFGDIIKPHVNNYIFYVNFKEEQENGKKNEDHGR